MKKIHLCFFGGFLKYQTNTSESWFECKSVLNCLQVLYAVCFALVFPWWIVVHESSPACERRSPAQMFCLPGSANRKTPGLKGGEGVERIWKSSAAAPRGISIRKKNVFELCHASNRDLVLVLKQCAKLLRRSLKKVKDKHAKYFFLYFKGELNNYVPRIGMWLMWFRNQEVKQNVQDTMSQVLVWQCRAQREWCDSLETKKKMLLTTSAQHDKEPLFIMRSTAWSWSVD